MHEKIYTFILIFLAVTGVALSQANTTSSIDGFVKNTNGEPMLKAKIRVEHVPSGTKSSTVANTKGKFTVLGLKAGGPYRIVITCLGYESQRIDSVYLSLNQTFNTNVSLKQLETMAEAVVVESNKDDDKSTVKTSSTFNINNKDIRNLPTLERSIHDYSRLSPLIVPSLYNGSSAGGRNMRYNNITVDGATINDAFGLTTAGGTLGGSAGTQPISLDVIDQFQVSISPFDIKEGGFTGGLINAISKSGTNHFNGSVYYYGRNHDFVGKNPITHAAYPDFNEMQLGATVGGPIVENKLFYFANFEMGRKNIPVLGGLLGSNEANVFGVSADSMRIIRDAVREKYGYDPGTFDNYTSQTNNYKLFLKLDYNINDDHRLSVRHNFVTGSHADGVLRDKNNYSFSNREFLTNSTINQTVAQLNSIFTNELVNEFKISLTDVKESRIVPESSKFPSVTLRNMGADGKGLVMFGVDRFSHANSINQNLLEFTDNLSYFWENHVFTIGTSNQIVYSDNLFMSDYYGTYEFSNDGSATSLENFLAGKPSRYTLSYANTAVTGGKNAFNSEITYFQWSVYAQDVWNIMENLKVNYGIRADMINYLDKPYHNPVFSTPHNWYGMPENTTLETTYLASPLAISPRFGFNWDIENNKKYQLRGGAGLFSGRTPGVWISNQFTGTGMDSYKIDERNTQYTFSPDVNNQPKPDNPKAQTTEINIIDKDIKMPQIMRANLGFDYNTESGLILTLEALYGMTIYDMEYQNINLQYQKNEDGSIATAIDGRNLYQNGKNSSVDDNFTKVIYLKNTNQGEQLNLVAQIQKPYGEGILPNMSANLSYTYCNVYDVNQLSSSRGVSNWQYRLSKDPNKSELSRSSIGVPHRILANIAYTFDYSEHFSTTIGIYYEGRSGLPFSFVYQEDANGDNVFGNDLAYIPTGEDDEKFVLVSNNWAELNEFIDHFDKMKEYRGKIMDRNMLYEPWRNSLDLRLTQDFNFMGYKLQVTLDAINFLNLLHSDWGHAQYLRYNSYNLFSFHGYDKETGKIKASFRPKKGGNSYDIFNVDDLSSRWQLQLGVRFSF